MCIVRVYSFCRQIDGLVRLTRQWKLLKRPTRRLKTWTRTFEPYSRKSKVKRNLNSAPQRYLKVS